jgi:hypothetical protein
MIGPTCSAKFLSECISGARDVSGNLTSETDDLSIIPDSPDGPGSDARILEFGVFDKAEPSRRAPPKYGIADWSMSVHGVQPQRENAFVAAAI